MKYNFEQLDVPTFKELLDTGEYILLDVRTPGELIMYGKISDNQRLIDINDASFVSQIGELDKTQKYLVYCWHGTRSVVARNYMREQGFVFVADLEGGIDAWNREKH